MYARIWKISTPGHICFRKKEVLLFLGRREWNGRELVREIRTPVPLVEIADDRRVLIENHQGVCSYTAEQVQVRVRYGRVCITGSGLRIVRMTREQLVICGTVEEVALHRGGGQNGR